MKRDIEVQANNLDETFRAFDSNLSVSKRVEWFLLLTFILSGVVAAIFLGQGVEKVLLVALGLVIGLLVQLNLTVYRLISYCIYILRDNKGALQPLLKLLISTFRGNLH